MEEKKRTVAVYARVSTEHEAQLSALDNQVQYYDNILQQHPEWTLYKSYIDEGITGTSTKKRKNFMSMMADAAEHRFDLIITREVSRFARNTVDTLQETRKLKKLGVEVWFTEDNIWTMNDEDGELRLTIMATLAQNESKKTSLRVKAGQMISFQNAVPYGNGNIMGYDRVETKVNGIKQVSFVINPEQARVVRLIYDLYLAGNGMKKIQYELERRGELTATGLTRWEQANISRILNNEFYAGVVVYRKQFVPDYLEQKKINNFGEVPKIRVQGAHEPIITEEEFQRCQEIRYSRSASADNRGRKGIRTSGDVWVRKVTCSCGSPMYRRRWRVVDGIPQYCYQCKAQAKFGSYITRVNHGLDVDNCCKVKMIPKWKLLAVAELIFRESWSDKRKIIEIADDLLEKYQTSPQLNEVNDIYTVKVKEKEKLDRQLKNLVDLRISELIDSDTYIEKRKHLLEQIEAINEELDRLKGTLELSGEKVEEKLLILKHALAKLAGDTSIIPDEVIDAFVNSVIVHEDHMEWHLNFKPLTINSFLSGKEKQPNISLETSPPTDSVSSTSGYSRVTLIESACIFLGTFEIPKDYMKRYVNLYCKNKRFKFPEKLVFKLFLV